MGVATSLVSVSILNVCFECIISNKDKCKRYYFNAVPPPPSIDQKDYSQKWDI